MGKKLYVGNLSLETTEGELQELFGHAGSVDSVRIIRDRETGRSKGCGFVEMQDGGDRAIAEMNAGSSTVVLSPSMQRGRCLPGTNAG